MGRLPTVMGPTPLPPLVFLEEDWRLRQKRPRGGPRHGVSFCRDMSRHAATRRARRATVRTGRRRDALPSRHQLLGRTQTPQTFYARVAAPPHSLAPPLLYNITFVFWLREPHHGAQAPAVRCSAASTLVAAASASPADLLQQLPLREQRLLPRRWSRLLWRLLRAGHRLCRLWPT